MTICQDVEAQLSQLVDGLLPDPAVQATVREHLESCAACRGVLQDLERLRRASRALGPMTPPDHVWLEVAGQVRLGEHAPAPDPPRRAAAPRAVLAQWIGLAAALVIITVGAYYFGRITPPPAPGVTAGNVPPPGTVEGVTAELSLATQHYENAIAQLEAMTTANAGTLDPEMAQTLQRNIQTIDQAIAESRSALTQDPGSEPARESLFQALRRKVGVLQATVTLMNEMRKGNQAGAAAAAAAVGRKS